MTPAEIANLSVALIALLVAVANLLYAWRAFALQRHSNSCAISCIRRMVAGLDTGATDRGLAGWVRSVYTQAARLLTTEAQMPALLIARFTGDVDASIRAYDRAHK